MGRAIDRGEYAPTGAIQPGGRLTLQSFVPVMTATQSAKTTLYYTSYVGDQIPIYDGVSMVATAITGGEISASTTDTTKSPAAIGSGKINDWFVWNDAGTLRLSHGPDWTSEVARSAGTALNLVKGIYLNLQAITNGPAASRGTYVGSTRSDGSSQLLYGIGGTANGGSAPFLFVWNMYNRVTAYGTSVDNISYTYTSNVVREAHGSSNNRAYFLTGLAEDAIDVRSNARCDALAATNSFVASGFGLDTSAANAAGTSQVFHLRNSATSHAYGLANAAIIPPQLGVHYVARVENGDSLNANGCNAGLIDFISISLRM